MLYGLIAVFKGHRLLPDFTRLGFIYRCIKLGTGGTNIFAPGLAPMRDYMKGLGINLDFTSHNV